MPRRWRLVALALTVFVAGDCVEGPTGPGSQDPATVRVELVLPAGTPVAWRPAGDTLRILFRRAGRVEPVVDTAAVTDALEARVTVPLDQAVERFVATAELSFGGQVLFIAFDAVQLRASLDTTILLTAAYVGPGGTAAALTAAAGDSTLEGGDTTTVVATALDSLDQSLGRVPVRFLVDRPDLFTVDSTGLVTALDGAPDTARVVVVMPTGLEASLPLSLVSGSIIPATRTWAGGDPSGPTNWSIAGNWNPAGAPDAADTVLIDDAANQPSLTTAVTVARLSLAGGSLTLNGHPLTVTGDFSTENGAGTVTMQQPGDTLAVGGNAVFQGGATFGLLTDGVLLVAGDLELRTFAEVETFQAFGNHRTVLNGSGPQRLVPESNVTFGHLEIANAGGGVLATLETTIEVEGAFTITTPTRFDGGDNSLDVEGTVFTVVGSTLSALELRLFSTLTVGGVFDVSLVEFANEDAIQLMPDSLTYQNVLISGTTSLIGATVVDGFLRIDEDSDANLTLDGHALVVSLLDVGGFDRQGTLTMRNAQDRLHVRGDAIFQGDPTAGLLTDGILSVAGDFRHEVDGAFEASGDHRLVLDGAGPQEMVFNTGGAVLSHLEIVNTGAGVTITTSEEVVELTVGGELRVSTPVPVRGDNAALDVGDSIVTDAGSALVLSALTMRGGLRIAGALDVRSAHFAGAGQEIPAQADLRDVEVSGTARLLAPMAFPGFVFVRGAGADLALNGHRLDVGAFTTGGATFPTGTLTSTDPADSLVVASDAAFFGGATTGLLTAGTLIVGGGFFQGEDPSAFQPSGTHRTVLNGATQQVVRFATPGVTGATSRFQHLDLSKPAGEVVFQTAAVVGGELRADGASPQVVTGPGLLSVGGVDVAGLTVDGVALAVGVGPITRFDDVTFQNQDPAAVQLSVAHPGAATPFTFDGVRFLMGPGTGSYVSATDLAPGDGNVLTINLTDAVPADGSARTLTSGGAVVTWAGVPPAPGSFTSTGSMTAPHTGGAAGVLHDGTVLVAGGLSTGGDRYDPATGVFTATPGSMTRFREGLTATTLPDGRVLVTGGGQVFPATTRTAELFDPASGTFALTDSLGDAVSAAAQGRRYHTATLLADGRVLVVGGEGVTSTSQLYRLASAETYDQTTETFTVQNNPGRARSRHAAVRLQDGRAMVIGGRTNFNDFGDPNVELFDPTTGGWANTGSMNAGRNGHTATLLTDGRVLVTGGSDLRDDANRRLATAEVYDPATGTFTATGSMAARRQYHFAVRLPDGKVLVGGGRDENNLFPLGAELYDPATGTFTPTGTMAFGDERMVAVALPDGRVLVAASTVAQVYQP